MAFYGRHDIDLWTSEHFSIGNKRKLRYRSQAYFHKSVLVSPCDTEQGFSTGDIQRKGRAVPDD